MDGFRQNQCRVAYPQAILHATIDQLRKVRSELGSVPNRATHSRGDLDPGLESRPIHAPGAIILGLSTYRRRWSRGLDELRVPLEVEFYGFACTQISASKVFLSPQTS